ncbi:MAG TPA: GAF domain-containing protein [Sphingomicrobium sp.]|nr:GAF domain-containing protein [Sphingomicrobium sp.]
MWRFLLKENIRRFRNQLAEAKPDAQRETLARLLQEAEAELRELENSSTPEVAKNDAALKHFSERSIDEAMRLDGAQFGTLQIHDERSEGLIILAQRNFRAEFLRPFTLIKPDEGSLSGRCFVEGRTIVVEDVNEDPSFKGRRELAREGGFKAVQSSPLKGRSGKVIGVLSTHFADPHRFSHEDIGRIERFANSVGCGLEKHLAAQSRDDPAKCG